MPPSNEDILSNEIINIPPQASVMLRVVMSRGMARACEQIILVSIEGSAEIVVMSYRSWDIVGSVELTDRVRFQAVETTGF